ncbi:MAG: AAA family ATPase [Thermofilaceae archaeon]|nr:AAA family ATPase [Thermofilaceae archaeon]
MFCLSEEIYNVHVKSKGAGGLLITIIVGEPGTGKTSYALKVAKEVYKELGYNDPWTHAVQHTFVTFQQYGEWSKKMLEKYKKWAEGGCKEKYEKTPVIVIDDLFGQQLDRYGWREKQVQSFSAIFNMIRSLTSAVLLTTPVRAFNSFPVAVEQSLMRHMCHLNFFYFQFFPSCCAVSR